VDAAGVVKAARTAHIVPSLGCLMTGGFDCALRFWSLTEPNKMVHVEALPAKVRCAWCMRDVACCLCAWCMRDVVCYLCVHACWSRLPVFFYRY
jgi:hypothetical protein